MNELNESKDNSLMSQNGTVKFYSSNMLFMKIMGTLNKSFLNENLKYPLKNNLHSLIRTVWVKESANGTSYWWLLKIGNWEFEKIFE